MSPPMKRQMIRAWVANALCLAALLWLYAGDLRNALAARRAEVSAFQELPSVLQPALVLAATALALGFALYGLARRRGPDFRGYRLLPIVLVSALFVDLLFSESEVPVSSAGAATFALQHFAAGAQELASGGRLPTRPEKLQPLLEQLGRPPYLVRGAPASAYGLQVREGCEGPVTEAPGAEVGTLLYCVGPRAQVAWAPIGVVLLARTPGHNASELVYLGLVPAANGADPLQAQLQRRLDEEDRVALPGQASLQQ